MPAKKPDEFLQELREIVHTVDAAQEIEGGDGVDMLLDMTRAFDGLDKWLTNAGDLPEDWQVP